MAQGKAETAIYAKVQIHVTSSAKVKTSEKVFHLKINLANLLLKQLFVTWSFTWVIGR